MCHIHTCQSPLKAYCTERATHIALVLEPGMNIEPVEIEVCEWCLPELMRDGIVEPQRPIA